MPNIELAHKLANEENYTGIEEIIENLTCKDKKNHYDCIKVAYEIGQVKPELICPDFYRVAKKRNNRLVLGRNDGISNEPRKHQLKSVMKV